MEKTISELSYILRQLNNEYKEVEKMETFTKDFKDGYKSALGDLSITINERILTLRKYNDGK